MPRTSPIQAGQCQEEDLLESGANGKQVLGPARSATSQQPPHGGRAPRSWVLSPAASLRTSFLVHIALRSECLWSPFICPTQGFTLPSVNYLFSLYLGSLLCKKMGSQGTVRKRGEAGGQGPSEGSDWGWPCWGWVAPTAPGESGRLGRPWTATERTVDWVGDSTHLTRGVPAMGKMRGHSWHRQWPRIVH